MSQRVVLLYVLILITVTGITYGMLSPTNYKQLRTPPPPKAVSAIKKYAAVQFNVPESNVTLVNSSKQAWQDICLGIKIPDYDCTKRKIAGYEVTVEADGSRTIYRGSDDGSIIRIVK